MKLTVGYLYPELLNLYGDNGNVEIICKRAQRRGFDVEVINISHDTPISLDLSKKLDFIFMGGGPDSSQNALYEDFVLKKDFLEDFIENNGVGLFVCGGYQLLGNYYEAATGKALEGLGLLDFHTKHFGEDKPRCIGNIAIKPSNPLLGNTVVGFENHGGRTYLGEGVNSLGSVLSGFGNNGEDNTEGVIYKNCFGTYLHGPILAKNNLFADYLLAASLKINPQDLPILDDTLVEYAHKSILEKIT